MSPVIGAAADLQSYCIAQGWQFCFIGGIAVQRWGVPRYTEDADLTLITRFVDDEPCCRKLLERFAARTSDAFDFAQRSRVLLLRHENGVELDVCLGALEFEVRSVSRAVVWRSPNGVELKVCCAEDLIVHKAFASRSEDWIDVQRVIEVQGRKLHVAQIFDELRPLAELKEDDGIITRLEWELKKQGLL